MNDLFEQFWSAFKSIYEALAVLFFAQKLIGFVGSSKPAPVVAKALPLEAKATLSRPKAIVTPPEK